MVGRQADLVVIDRLLGEARTGGGGALVLRGEAGIGKTSLLAAARERASGMRVLAVRAVETESELPFAGLSDLLETLRDALAGLPEPQAAALSGALGLGPPVPGDRFAVCAATASLLRATAADGPVLVLVDDVQWLDEASRECILYAARRAGDGLAVLLTTRLADGRDLDLGLPELQVGPLDETSARMLLRTASPELAASVEILLLASGAGNPLALVELVASLTVLQAAGQEALSEPLAPGPELTRAYRARFARLPDLSRAALLVAATADSEALGPVLAACGTLGLDASAFEPAEVDGLVELDADRLRFRHPLARGAVYHEAPPAERRRAHAALAAVHEGAPRAWHLANAALGFDDEAAAALEAAAVAALGRRGYVAASAALERAARLTEDPAARARRLLAAAQAMAPAGGAERADLLLEETLALAPDPIVRAQAQQLRGSVWMWSGRPAQAIELLVAQAGELGDGQRVAAAVMLADAAVAATMVGDCKLALSIAERAETLLGDDGDAAARAQVLSILGWSLVLRGEAARARPILAEVEELAPQVDPLSPAAQSIFLALNSRLPFEEFERARADCLRLVAAAREAGALASIPMPLVVAADAGYRLGDWDAVEDETQEAMQLAQETRQGAPFGHALVTRARLAAARGREDETRALVSQALEAVAASGQGSGARFLWAAKGFLELGLARIGPAIEALEETARLVEESGLDEPSLIPWAPDLIEAYVYDGRTGDAARVLALLDDQAARTGSLWAGAARARCEGLLNGSDIDACFGEALRLHDAGSMPFERARTLLAYGSRLHRARRRVEARVRLREALSIFDGLGAVPWSERTWAELRAAGAVRRRSSVDGKLTEQELRVAAALARGLKNREIASELFLSPKTVEFHLGRIYRKLGLRSRSQLAALVAAGGLAQQDGATSS